MPDSQRVSFYDCLMVCARTHEFVENFDRLTGTSLSRLSRRSPLDVMIDAATGYERDQVRQFVEFVWECVYTRLPPEVVAGQERVRTE